MAESTVLPWEVSGTPGMMPERAHVAENLTFIITATLWG